jgi:starvation-inducible DNA-binding protein
VVAVGATAAVSERAAPRDPAASSIKDAQGVPTAEDMIRELVAGQEAVVRTARAVFPVVERASDEPSADLLTQRMQVHEKNAWMLRSLLSA